jgi:hypothetical protein
MLGQLI